MEGKGPPAGSSTPSRRGILALAAGSLLLLARPQPALADVLEHRTIRFVVGGSFPPFTVLSEDGGVSGVYAEALAAIGRDLGWTFQFAAVPWARAQDMVRTAQADSFITVPTTPRQEYALFAGEPLLERQGIAIVYAAASPRRAAIERIATTDDLRDFALVDYIGNGWGDSIWRGWPTVERVRDLRALVRMVATGRADLAVQPRAVVEAIARQSGLQGQLLYRTADFTGHSPSSAVHFALRRSFPDAARMMALYEQAQQRFIARGGVEELMERWS